MLFHSENMARQQHQQRRQQQQQQLAAATLQQQQQQHLAFNPYAAANPAVATPRHFSVPAPHAAPPPPPNYPYFDRAPGGPVGLDGAARHRGSSNRHPTSARPRFVLLFYPPLTFIIKLLF